jgi:adenylate cyclase
MTTCALSYLLAERLVRPVVAEAMDGLDSAPDVVLGVRRRVLLAWALGSAVPLGGIFVGVADLGRTGALETGGLLFLSGVGLVSGLLASMFTARSIADPVESVTGALRQVAGGRFDVRVPVYDGSEVGQLQSGLNSMVAGLRERERLRDLFGRQVGTEVARLALEQGVRLGGERRDVAVLFVDVVGSTALAVQAEPEEVVRQLNAFFTVVVDAVGSAGGWVNKFEGDAALCIFGAPAERPDAGACALAAARALARGLEPLPLDAAIGVAAGPVVAGHVGTEQRFEYTVIGDAVNSAARLTELARDRPGRVVADADLLAAAGEEADEWELADEVVLRGRSSPTRLAVPRERTG